MRQETYIMVGFLILILAVFLFPLSFSLRAQETYIVGQVQEIQTERFTNNNWFSLPHPKIVTFTIEENGNMFGLTETGIPFRQFSIQNEVGIRVQRFEIEDHYHYIVDGTPVYSFEALSVELANAYNKEGLRS